MTPRPRRSESWRILVLVAAVLAVAFGALGLHAYQANEVVECEVPGATGTQKFFSNVGDDVGEGCQYADRQVQGVQTARWWWYGAGSVLVLTAALLPLSLRPRREDEVAAAPPAEPTAAG